MSNASDNSSDVQTTTEVNSQALPIPMPPLPIGRPSNSVSDNPFRALENPLRPETPESTFLLTSIRAAITIPILIIWIVVGLYIWIPLLLRRIFVYVGAVITSAITRETENVVLSGINLEHSLSFFYDGFVLIFHSLGLTGRNLGEQHEGGSMRAKEEFFLSTWIWCMVASVWLVIFLITNA
jgi:hypothetical protein